MTWIDAFGFGAFALNVWGNVLLARKNRGGWYVRIFSIVLWGAYGIGAASWPNVVNAITFLGINVYGLMKWQTEQRKEIDMRFIIKKSDDGQYYFVIQAAGNNATLATSETYLEKRDANAAILLIVNGATNAPVVDETVAP